MQTSKFNTDFYLDSNKMIAEYLITVLAEGSESTSRNRWLDKNSSEVSINI